MIINKPALMTNQVERVYVTRGWDKLKGVNRIKNIGFLINKKIYWHFSSFDLIGEMMNEVEFLNIRLNYDGAWGYVDENNEAILNKKVTQIQESNEVLFSPESKYAKLFAHADRVAGDHRKSYLWGISEIQDDYIGMKHYNGEELSPILTTWLKKTDINDMNFIVSRSYEKGMVEASFVMPLEDGTQLNFLMTAKQAHLGSKTTDNGVIKTYELTDFNVRHFYYHNKKLGINLLQRHKYMAQGIALYFDLSTAFHGVKTCYEYDEDGNLLGIRHSSERIGVVQKA